jgi:hypothetical protein
MKAEIEYPEIPEDEITELYRIYSKNMEEQARLMLGECKCHGLFHTCGHEST